MGNVHIKNTVVDVAVSSGNGISCTQNCLYKQNLCVKNSSEAQKFKILIDNEVMCKSIGQRNTARKQFEAPVINDTVNLPLLLLLRYQDGGNCAPTFYILLLQSHRASAEYSTSPRTTDA
jgi:hypothetical protein